jgi:hypothetical protein
MIRKAEKFAAGRQTSLHEDMAQIVEALKREVDKS